MNNQKPKELIKKYLAGQCTPKEEALVESWYVSVAGKLNDELPEPDYLAIKQEVFKAIQNNKKPHKLRLINLWPRLAVAASILLCVSAGGYFLLKSQSEQPLVTIKTHDISPGSNKAILTLANGRQIILSGTRNGVLATQGNTAITKTKEGQVVYQATDDHQPDVVVYNKIQTQRGGQYKIVLADGSSVWLNAASSITYPIRFQGADRTVAITGEAYFEVAHNPNMPFRVKSRGQTIQVLGTHFDVNAYDDESTIKTTLLEGRVKVTVDGHDAFLQPGQQSQVSLEGQVGILKGIQNADVDAAVAWKNGLFQFDKADIKTVMRQISRWYDVDVVYDGNIQERAISGSMYRNLSAAKVLELLSFENIHFTIDGKKIIITK